MEDFDIFTDEINITKPLYKNLINKLVYDAPSMPIAPNYHSGRKLLAEECLAEDDESGCTFHLSEAVSSSMRVTTLYRDDQRQGAANKLLKFSSYTKHLKDLAKADQNSDKKDAKFLKYLLNDTDDITKVFERVEIDNELPLHKRYLKFTKENTVDDFHRILKEFPKEWTVVQLTAPYNPNENLKPLTEFRTEMDSIYISVFTNDYLDECGMGPITVNIPANVTKEGEKPLFVELYSILDENYKTIDNAQFLNNKRLVQNYWNKREDIDLRMKSVLNVMDKEWLGGWGCLLTGGLVDSTWKCKIVKKVDETIADWGFIKLSKKQKILLYNLIESCQSMTSYQIKSCIRKILTEHGNPEDIRQVLHPCEGCSKDFRFINEVCLKCLSNCFSVLHHFSVVDGIRAFSQLATQVKEGEEWAALKEARRNPVILIVDEMLDTFPWESLAILKDHPVSRIENIHFLYYLYKLHEKDVVDGYFTTKGHGGRYVINPEKNLDRMEKRMSSFVQYWCKEWKGWISQPPPPEDFIDYLTNADIFLYCGHGDGCHFANGSSAGAGIEGCEGARALCILSGCGSVRLAHGAGRAPPTGAHRRLHTAGSPMVIGMLWEVTDLEVDKVVSTLVSLCVPSAARTSWHDVGKAKWSQGELELSAESKSPVVPEPDVLRAAARARRHTHYAMIASSVVARGLPVMIR